jgi:hypothetical protein
LAARVVVVPEARPKTKPRALNHGLVLARGEFLVVYDAEDRPERDQIAKAVAAFAALPDRTICLQARLAWANADDNALTRLFALEYQQWFGRYLPGLYRLGAVIPLGGTSNHFRTAALRDLGGWDPFNVAEDCDLGVRLRVAGYRTAVLDSTTWELAVTGAGPWLRQRTRWLKGYLATHAVWGRRPVHLARRLGPRALFGYLLVVPAVPLLAGVSVALWTVLAGYTVAVGIDVAHGHRLLDCLGRRDWAGGRWSWPLWYGDAGEHALWAPASVVLAVVAGMLLIGNLVFVALAAWAGTRPGERRRGRWAVLMPAYWLFQGVAAWRACWQALGDPHRWEKTEHRPMLLHQQRPGVNRRGSPH